MAKYKAKSKYMMKCYVCGSKDFTEIYVENATSRMCLADFGMGGDGNHKRDAWLYACIECGHLMLFSDKAALHEPFI